MKKISATKLSKALELTLSNLQDALVQQKLIYKKDKIYYQQAPT
jgi:hypothetical protein